MCNSVNALVDLYHTAYKHSFYWICHLGAQILNFHIVCLHDHDAIKLMTY